MSLLRSVLSVVSPLVLAAATLSAGCTTPYKSLACLEGEPNGTPTGCPTQEQIGHDVFDGGDSAPPVAMCCNDTTTGNSVGICVIASSGCDSGYRLISKHGINYDVSVCVPTTMNCEAQFADMSQPAANM